MVKLTAIKNFGQFAEVVAALHYRVVEKLAPFLYALTSSNTYHFSNLFHCQNQEKIGNDSTTKYPITPQVCRYTTLWNGQYLMKIRRTKMMPFWATLYTA